MPEGSSPACSVALDVTGRLSAALLRERIRSARRAELNRGWLSQQRRTLGRSRARSAGSHQAEPALAPRTHHPTQLFLSQKQKPIVERAMVRRSRPADPEFRAAGWCWQALAASGHGQTFSESRMFPRPSPRHTAPSLHVRRLEGLNVLALQVPEVLTYKSSRSSRSIACLRRCAARFLLRELVPAHTCATSGGAEPLLI